MADAFIPLFSTSPKAQSAGSNGGKEPFVAVAGAASHAPNLPSNPAAGQHRPVVKLQREGDRVRTIRVECSCGQVIELDCVY